MKKLLNDGWEYLKLPLDSTWEDAVHSSGWKEVTLPHDWLIWQCNDLYESADAWYRRNLCCDADSMPETCLLCFDGVYMDCDVLLNGQILSSHAYGYTAFTVNMTGKLRSGQNEIMVHIRHRSPNSRWYSGSGIIRDVHLLELPEQYIVPDSFYFTEKQKGEAWELTIEAETSKTDRILFSCSVCDAFGNRVATGETFSAEGRIWLQMILTCVQAWDVDHPVLYTLHYVYGKENGFRNFGLRSVQFSPDKGFLLNGRVLKLKGVCLHHDLGALGAAFHEKAARRQLKLMKEMGVNAVRTSHNPPASRFLDLCDEMGILVNDEAFDMWERPKTKYDYARFFPEKEAEDVGLWIRRDRCHPCVIMWSIGNEIYDMHADLRGTEVCELLMNQVREHDPKGHAAVTFGCNYMPWEGGQRCADIVKTVGYNYGEKLYAEHHTKHPDWVIYGSETASVLSSRAIYHFPIEKMIMSEVDLQCSALGNSNTSWGTADLRRMIVEDLNCPFSMGQFIWSGIDYIGEPTPYHTRNCYFGQADTACFPKDSFYLFQSMWSSEPVLHIGVYWDWNPGQLIDVPVMTNYSRVELLLNGKSLGIREVKKDDPEKCCPVWKVPYEAGELTARAVDRGGNVLCETVRRTSGNTAALVISSEDPEIKGDGHDLAFLTIQAVDTRGNPVENARDRVLITVTGGAYLIGTDNGDSTDPDSYKQNSRRLFGGKLLAVLCSNGTEESAKVCVESTEGIRTDFCIPVCPAKPLFEKISFPEIQYRHNSKQIPVRKIEICTENSRILDRENPECFFTWKEIPEHSTGEPVKWQITNSAGIETPFTELTEKEGHVSVTAKGDGEFYLRAVGGNNPDHPEIISQIEFTAKGIGNPSLNPYSFVCAGLYDIHKGEIGTGNEKGIAFARDGESMVGFSNIDFGKAGSDTLVLPVFALNGDPYKIELFDGVPDQGGKLISVLHYEKPSIWNQYQEETYRLPERLTGIHTLCFRMKDKVHLKGFRFMKQSRAFDVLSAGSADMIYGDTFSIDGCQVKNIGNNVSLLFEEMDFGDAEKCRLMIRGKTERQVNAVTIQIRNAEGIETTGVADFVGNGGAAQEFPMIVPGGLCTVSFVFLPGSAFDFEDFRFSREE